MRLPRHVKNKIQNNTDTYYLLFFGKNEKIYIVASTLTQTGKMKDEKETNKTTSLRRGRS